MKVLFSTYPMAFHTPGGGEVQLKQYYDYLIREGIDVDLFDLWKPELLAHDILHFFSCIGGSIHFTSFVKNLGIPVLVSPNLWITHESKGDYACDEIRAQLLVSDRIICNSDAECNLLSEVLDIPREKFKTVYNGVEEHFLERVSPNLFKSNFDINEPFVLNVANLETRKNQLNLIKAMKNFPNMKLVIIGHERDPIYAKQCFDAGGEQVIYIGPLAHDSDLLKSAYAGCELFALPSTLETPGLAALEAAASGARIVITNEGSTKEYFGENAFYVNALEESSIVEGIHNALLAPKGNLVEHVRSKFTWPIVLKELVNIYYNHNLFSSSEIKVRGLNLSEYNGDEIFVWTKKHVFFECKFDGILSFKWRAVEQAYVDIKVNGEIVAKSLLVDSGWVDYSLTLHKQNHDVSTVELIIKPVLTVPLEDDRELGVALTHINFAKENEKKN